MLTRSNNSTNHLKKLISIVLAFTLLISTVTGCRRDAGSNTTALPALSIEDATIANRAFYNTDTNVQNAIPLSLMENYLSEELLTPRYGYILVPTMHSTTGIDTLSTFHLIVPYAIQPDSPMPTITIDGQPNPRITFEGNNTFLVAPSMPLSNNSVYVFRLARNGQPDITWAFQTNVRFEILSSLPRHQATNVPVQTGIEIIFSTGTHINIEDNFHIYPPADGRFITRDNITIFMPENPLEHSTIYTINVSAGTTFTGTNETISTDFSFAFETAPREPSQATHNNSRVHFSFSQTYVEFPSFEAPTLFFWLNYRHNAGVNRRPTIYFDVYEFGSIQDAIQAANQIVSVPFWSTRFHMDNYIDTAGLENVYSSRMTTRQSQSEWNEYFTLSNTLSPGFYIINAVVDDAVHQAIIQITDIAVQIAADNDMALVWMNDMHTGQPIANAIVHDAITNRVFTATEYGIAIVDRALSAGEYLIINNESIVFIDQRGFQSFHNWGNWGWDMPFPVTRAHSWSPMSFWGGSNAPSQYWTALQLDRTLFQPNDTVSLWGFVQNRRTEEHISHVSITVQENSWWHGDDRDVLLRQNIPVAYGAFSGEISLPGMSPGFYMLTVYHGDVVLHSTFFTVQDFVTPPYQLNVSSDKVAIFAGEQITYTANVAFFEGTPVPDISLSYWSWGHDINTSGANDGIFTTDINGNVTRSFTPIAANQNAQGVTSHSFSTEATLPEIGWTHQSASTLVFINDIDVSARASREGRNATLEIDVNTITLDRLNNGTSTHFGDFLCTPVTGKQISVDIYRIYWESVRSGTRFDHITRQVVPMYRHERREQRIDQFTLTTDNNGHVSRNFQVPDRQNESYEARIRATDGNGRTIRHSIFVGQNWSHFWQNANEGLPFIYGANPYGYDIGDIVELLVKNATEPVTQGNVLFVMVQDGILSYQVGKNSLSFEFTERHVPNVNVFAFHFNGHTYHTSGRMTQSLIFNASSREMFLEISTCQESYSPGETATITINATNVNGEPLAGNINISLVDEALFALMEHNVNTIMDLYRPVDDRLRFGLATHRTFISDGIADAEWAFGATAGSPASAQTRQSSGDNVYTMAVAESDSADAGGAGAHVRQRFEETAAFKSIRTNAQGVATFSFELPDNITTWRIVASGISDDFYAGNSVDGMRVTNPMFLNYTLNRVFLTGDMPYLGVNAFGTSLRGGEVATFEVWCESNPINVVTATGTAFERINIPLWRMENEGPHALIIRATAAGYSDIVRHTFDVVTSHRTIDNASFYNVSLSTQFATNADGLTNITFTDLGRGQFLHSLMGKRWTRGVRLEGLVAQREATALITAHFPDTTLWGSITAFDISNYQQADGGISSLPHSASSLHTTVLVMPFVMDEINLIALRDYFNNILRSPNSQENKMMALYGLAMLGEPVLLELRQYAQVENLSVRNMAYVALGLAALGETHLASEIYNSRLLPYVQAVAPYSRVYVGNNRRDILDATSVVALLAATLGKPESTSLHNYTARNHTDNMTQRLESLAFIAREINNVSAVPASITYTLLGSEVTRDLSNGRQFTLRIPAANMHEFNITAIMGEVSAVSITRVPLEEVEQVENNITVRREFFAADPSHRGIMPSSQARTEFEQDEIIRVQITIVYDRRALDGSYIITDFLPAGLRLVENSARFGTVSNVSSNWRHVQEENQRITFFDFNGRTSYTNMYYYYARVINPGVFRADGTLVQSFGALEYFTVGDDAVVRVRG